MSTQYPQMKIRIPPDLKEEIQIAAAKNKRSMNAEIIARLQDCLSAEAQPEGIDMRNEMRKIAREEALKIIQEELKRVSQ